MFERFTARARRALVVAQEEARHMNHNFLGTEHILLGLVADPDGVAGKVLVEMGVSPERCRAAVEERIGPGQEAGTGAPPFTPRAKKVLELSLREALQLGHNYIGTEHLLLGLIREGEGVAAAVLTEMGAELDAVRAKVIEHLKGLVIAKRTPTTGTQAGQQVLERSAVHAGNEPMGSHHLLLGILEVGDSLGARVLESFGLTIEAATARIEEMGTKGTSDEVKRVRKRAVKLAPGITLSVDEGEMAAGAELADALDLSRDELARIIDILREALDRATETGSEADGEPGGTMEGGPPPGS